MNNQTNIQLNLLNSSNETQNVSLFDLQDVATSSNTQQYTWDVTSFTFVGQQTVTIEQKPIGATSFITYSAPLTTFTFQGVCNALNTLGFGTFFTYTSGGSTYISVYTLTSVFATLDIYNSVNLLILTYNGTNFPVSNPNSVSDWNIYFDTANKALEDFHSVNVSGTVVSLYGGIGFSLNNVRTGVLYSDVISISDNNTVTSVEANGCQGVPVTSVSLPKCVTLGDSAFDACSSLINISLPLVTTAGETAFGNCSSLTTISLPSLISIGDSGMLLCTSLTTIYIPACLQLGSTTGDNGVFDLIIGNTITLTIPLATSTDGDVAYLQANNTVTLITT